MIHSRHKGTMNGKGGFTLVETLIAIVVLTIATTAAMSALQIGLRGSGYAKNEITAYYLAEEGIETVRFIRDTNSLTPGSYWLKNIESNPTCIGAMAKCDVDLSSPTTPALKACPSSGCYPLRFDPNGSAYYLYSSSASSGNSQFTRTIQITRKDTSAGSGTYQVEGNDAILVKSTVTWSGVGVTNRSVTLEDELYNWQ